MAQPIFRQHPYYQKVFGMDKYLLQKALREEKDKEHKHNAYEIGRAHV